MTRFTDHLPRGVLVGLLCLLSLPVDPAWSGERVAEVWMEGERERTIWRPADSSEGWRRGELRQFFASPDALTPSLTATGDLLIHFHLPMDEAAAIRWAEQHHLTFKAFARHDHAALFSCAPGGDCIEESKALLELPEVKYAYPNWKRVRPIRAITRPSPGNNRANASPSLGERLSDRLAVSDLSLSARESVDPAPVGTTFKVVVKAYNRGPATARNPVITFTPATSLSATILNSRCQGTRPLRCTLSDIPEGRSATLEFTVKGTSAGTFDSTISVATSSRESDSSNNSTTLSTTIGTPGSNGTPGSGGSATDLGIAATLSPNPPAVGASAMLTITVTNLGASTASDLKVTYALPASLLSSSTTASRGSCSGSTQVTCTLSTLAAGAQMVITTQGRVQESSRLSFEATLSSSTSDTDETNNSVVLISDPVVAVNWNDALYPEQWHLEQSGTGASETTLNVLPAWQRGLRGRGVTLAVVDDGLELAHEDLAANVSTALSYDYNGGDADPSHNQHGTSVAGLIGAVGGNGKGVVGVAPEVTLVGLRAESTDDFTESLVLDHNAAIDIYNNSWGPEDGGFFLEGPGPLVLATMKSGVEQGRGGKGLLYCWAAGNGTSNDNSNYDGYANSRYAIAVSAFTDLGVRASYSEPGANLLVTAPSDGGYLPITTTDRTGNLGYNTTGGYANDFGGTSASAPMVCGGVALLLEANPNLGWRDIHYLLALSAHKVDSGNADWVLNGASHWVNHSYGFGSVDLGRAAAMAEVWSNLPAEISAEASVQPNRAIPDDSPNGITTLVNINKTLYVESVELLFTASDHPYWGDLKITLTSPSGTESVLADAHFSSAYGSYYDQWTFMSRRHLGENAKGNWTLRVADLNSGDTGTLNSWTLRVHGTATPPALPATLGTADLALAAQASDTRYTLRLRNNGPELAERAIVTITPPPGTTITSSSADGAACTGSSPLSCSVGSLAANQSQLIQVDFASRPTGEISARVAGTQADPDSSNNQLGVIPQSPTGDVTSGGEALRQLRIVLSGSGPGRVFSDDGTIDCRKTCTVSLPQGGTVKLRAEGSSLLSRFDQWGGTCAGGGAQCTFGMTDDLVAEALFSLTPQGALQ